MNEDPEEELRAIQKRARKKALRRWMVMGPGMATMIAVWLVTTPFSGWLPAALAGGVVGAFVTVALEKRLPPVDDDD